MTVATNNLTVSVGVKFNPTRNLDFELRVSACGLKEVGFRW
jgi:hypothetical protein